MHNAAGDDQRTAFERDRDRVLYSSAFHRLAGVTQIVRAGEEDVFHTRQQHSFKVAQVGRRLTQLCVSENPELAKHLGVEPEVVEAACLAHDVGHPPFGHVGEKALDQLMRDKNVPEGFEGNAQTFRIVTKLSVRWADQLGLDLTRATLAACLKYPWTRDTDVPHRKSKWSAYKSEQSALDFARNGFTDEFMSTEANLMDWADDIAYSVHDIEDFHRCSAVPWNQILDDEYHQAEITERALGAWFDAPENSHDLLKEAWDRLLEFFKIYKTLREPYNSERDQRQELRHLTSQLIARYMSATKLADSETGIAIGEVERSEVRLLKQITRQYIIANPSLIAQQKGHEKIISFVFNALHEEIQRLGRRPSFMPKRTEYLWKIDGSDEPIRYVADCIAGLTEREVSGLFERLNGTSSGSVLNPILR